MVSVQEKDMTNIDIKSSRKKSSLEKRLKRLSHPCVRKIFLGAIHEELTASVINLSDCFPYACVEALDKLIVKLIERESLEETPSARYPQIAVVEGEYHFELKPVKYSVDNRNYFAYNLIFLGRTFRLLNIKENSTSPQTLPVNATLEGKLLTFSFYVPSDNGSHGAKENENTKKNNENTSAEPPANQSNRREKITKEYVLESYPFSSFFKRNTFNNSIGVAVKKTDPKGSFSLTKTDINLGYENANTYVMVFFGGSENYYFNLEGEMLFERLSVSETFEKKRISKALDIEERIKKFRAQKNALVRHLKHRWKNCPEYYQNHSGLIYIINGELIAKTDRLGDVNFPHIQKRKTISKVCVGVDYPDKRIRFVFAGDSVAVYNAEGIINAHQYPENIHIKYSMSKEINELGLISIITLSENRASWRKAGIIRTIKNTRYIFSAEEISERYGKPIESVKYVGIIMNNVTERYEILLKEENSEFTSLPAIPKIVASPKYTKRSKCSL